MEETAVRPLPEVEQLCKCSKCEKSRMAFPDATGKWDCPECGWRHYPSKDDYGICEDPEGAKLSKWARKLLCLLGEAKRDGIILSATGGNRGPFKVSAKLK